MKKIILILLIISFTFLSAQKSESFLRLSYNSMCCGTPSTAPVMNYIETFQKNSKGKKIEIFRQSGLGREGEFALYIGIDALAKSKQGKFVKGLEATITSQNNSRNQNRDGTVFFSSTDVIKKKDLSQLKNLIIHKKEQLK
nr:hypothetical protein [uncultured Chryseobacterium sp.]